MSILDKNKKKLENRKYKLEQLETKLKDYKRAGEHKLQCQHDSFSRQR